MNKKKFILSLAMGTLLINGVFANTPTKEIEPFDISSIEYIEDEIIIDLGFDTADYLPENFDPYKMYVDLNAIEYIEEEIVVDDFSNNLPEGFDAYAYPSDVQSINYIDENDSFSMDFDTKKHLPEDFNAYMR